MTRQIRCGINTDPKNNHGNPPVQALQHLGAEWVRFTFKDPDTGSQPSQFGFYDPVVQAMNQGDIGTLMILTNETLQDKPSFDADDAAWEAYIQRYATRCGQIAQHYGTRVPAYQIWNEPDLLQPDPGYDPRVRAAVFGPMLRAAYTAIKEVSWSTVVMGGLASGQPAYLQQLLDATGGVAYVDAAAIHPYGRRPTPDWPNPTWGFGVLGDLILAYQAVFDKPIWITEIGTRDTSVQDPFPRQTFRAVDDEFAVGVPRVFWFCWSDGMVPPLGVVDGAGTQKGSYASFQGFAGESFQEPTGVFDRPSVHTESRDGQAVRYVVVHSSDSPVGVPAESTVDYLAGPNADETSVHELVLPGDRVYRMVADDLAARHCETPTVQFPDGTPSHLANEVTWAISAYQVKGMSVGQEVLEQTIDRIVAACRRLQLDARQVLGHREIDPGQTQAPIGVDMDALRQTVQEKLLKDELLAEGEAQQLIQFNPGAALQQHIFAADFVPNSPEFDVEVNGVLYRGQRAEHLGTGAVRVYFAKVPDWHDVRFVERT